MAIRNLLFDADGVIQNWRPSAVEQLRGLLLDQMDFDDFLGDILAAEGPCMRGEGDFSQALGLVLERWDIQQPLEQVLKNWESIDVYPGMVQLIQQLQDSGIACHLATNQQSLRARYMRQGLAYDNLFNESFYSCDLGYAKPDPLYFSAILGKLDALGDESLFIDDRSENTKAAASVGLNVLNFNARVLDAPHQALKRELERLGVL